MILKRGPEYREYERFIKLTEKLQAFRDASRILCSDLEDLIRQFEKRTNTVVLEFEWKE